MEDIVAINSTNILMTDAPLVKLYTHMNRLYLYLAQNDQCYRGQDFVDISVVVVAYGEDKDGNLDRDNLVTSWNRTYPRYQINKNVEVDGFPPYNVWVQLSNHWHAVELHFNFQDKGSEDGSNNYESKTSRFEFDNRLTTLTNTKSSSFFISKLRDNLETTNNFSVWFGETPPAFVKWDLLSKENGSSMRQITEVFGNPPASNQTIQLLPCDIDYLNIVKYIMNHELVPAIIVENVGLISPDDARFTFRLYLNQHHYFINFCGNLQFLIDKTKDDNGN